MVEALLNFVDVLQDVETARPFGLQHGFGLNLCDGWGMQVCLATRGSALRESGASKVYICESEMSGSQQLQIEMC